jgi:hypothetical protein
MVHEFRGLYFVKVHILQILGIEITTQFPTLVKWIFGEGDRKNLQESKQPIRFQTIDSITYFCVLVIVPSWGGRIR